ncbi:peptide deformylase [Photobacterium indicum]|uniref:Peptide deformylase n=1 Tax=Photobacterium indicum TaxID=81447 RepID=A0A2T3L9Z1_9GAMM|nr:peptide deformylase [Photobacterium indicum]PSV48132.1 peptide deformylase [Photobacterium indicum]
MLASLEIIQLGNPLLRVPAEALSTTQINVTLPLLASLEQIMLSHQGVGIAAPQVGESLRVFIVASRPNDRYPHAPLMEPTIMINPELLWHSDLMEKDWEGCLSIPGIRAKVNRYTHIRVSYLNVLGDVIETEFTGFIARIFQHELDHLNGIVFLDRADKLDVATETEYRKLIGLNE